VFQGAVDAVQDRLRVEVVVGARVAGVAVGLLCGRKSRRTVRAE
jgi:hypothetical protein